MSNSESYLEFTIKIYPEHKGITNELSKLKPGSELIIRDVRTAAHDGSGTKTTVKPGSRRQIHYNGENVIEFNLKLA